MKAPWKKVLRLQLLNKERVKINKFVWPFLKKCFFGLKPPHP
jgi:hypothetical protein